MAALSRGGFNMAIIKKEKQLKMATKPSVQPRSRVCILRKKQKGTKAGTR
jgi:hypothetical protein